MSDYFRESVSESKRACRTGVCLRVEPLEDRTAPASQAFVIDTTADTPDANVGDGFARDAKNRTSLRAAIMEGNANANDAGVPHSVSTNLPRDRRSV